MVGPTVELARGEPKGHRGIKRKRRVLADKVVGRRMPHLRRSLLHGLQDLKGRNELSGWIHGDVEAAIGEAAHAVS